VTWSDGLKASIPLGKLRGACPCAACREERELRERPEAGLPILSSGKTVESMATVEQAELVGHYALRVYWEDGHSTGIYDFGLLRNLCESLNSGGTGEPEMT
jgi:ATP-binding protein involved in chromosome partitioning